MIRVVVNASPLIALSIIGRFDLLNLLFDEVYIPNGVTREILTARSDQSYAKRELADALKSAAIKEFEVNDKHLVASLLGKLHMGEVEVIIGAKELVADFAVLDEIKARNLSQLLGVDTIGTVGILCLAKFYGYISEIKPYLLDLNRNNFRISQKLIEKVLRDAGE